MSKKKKYAVFVPFDTSNTTFGDKHFRYDVKEFYSLQLAKKEQRNWSSALVVEIIVGEVDGPQNHN